MAGIRRLIYGDAPLAAAMPDPDEPRVNRTLELVDARLARLEQTVRQYEESDDAFEELTRALRGREGRN